MFTRGWRPSAQSTWPTVGRLILAAGLAIALISAPISVEPGSLDLTWQSAHGEHGGSPAPHGEASLGVAKG
jgi:hypothetical protein